MHAGVDPKPQTLDHGTCLVPASRRSAKPSGPSVPHASASRVPLHAGVPALHLCLEPGHAPEQQAAVCGEPAEHGTGHVTRHPPRLQVPLLLAHPKP